MSSRDDADRDEADLGVLLADLETTLSALQDELSAESGHRSGAQRPSDGDTGRGAPTGSDRDSYRDRSRREPPRPPSLRDLFRFTEQYTLPTVISLLETTIQSLELLRGVLRVADPDRSAFDTRDRSRERTGTTLGGEMTSVGRDAVSGVGRGAVVGLERALSELQRALSESDLPEEETSRELLQDAQRLSGEVSERLTAAQEDAQSERYGYREETRGESQRESTPGSDAVRIDVSDDLDRTDEDHQSAEDPEPETRVETSAEGVDIDVEAELASIKDQVEPHGGSDDSETDIDSGEDGPDSETVEEGSDSDTGEDGSHNDTGEDESHGDTGEGEVGADSPERDSSDSEDLSSDSPDEDETRH